jgi:hypothetical protein
MLASASAMGTACYADDLPPPAYAEGYQPTYYDGYMVYYDEGGRPFYYRDGAVAWINPGVPEYAGLVSHWRLYGAAYGRWYSRYGYRYHGWRGGFYRR